MSPSVSLPRSAPNPSLLEFTTMCHYRRVRNHFKRCGHYIDLPDEEIKCEDRFCKFAPNHPPDCVPPFCTEKCWQYHQFPQQYNPLIDLFCPACVQAGLGP